MGRVYLKMICEEWKNIKQFTLLLENPALFVIFLALLYFFSYGMKARVALFTMN